ncbi:hypothetical protein MXD81_33890 [Microbacteriaceae bacterium K1510]|nr:hypothetical protein [Microbacteriaceae bacterium K1510]
MRAALAILCTCVVFVLGAFVAPAEAGGYRDYGDGYYPRYGGYYPRYGGNVWYSSKCCYKKIIRHDARFVRIEPWRHYGYYGRPWREGYYGGGYRGGYYGRPVGYTDVYVGPAHRYNGYPPGYYNGGYNGYDGYDAYNSAACIQRRVPVLDGRGGWVWGFKQVCN